MEIEEIWKYYQKDISLAEKKIKETLNTFAPVISSVGEHIFMGGGKRIRPFLAILSAKLFGCSGEKASILACSVESIHTASLLHDDVVDGANIRRGRPSAHSLWGNDAVILVGDYLYSNALRLVNSLKSQRIMDAFTTATAKMSEGELIQLYKKKQCKKGDLRCISEEDYIRIITGKTAILMSAACKGGAVVGNASKGKEKALETFGLKFGQAFQMVDDILDYMADEKTLGKELGKDIEEGKVTLPLIYLLKKASQGEVEKIKSAIKTEKITKSDITYIVDLLNKYKSIEQSYKRAGDILKEAKAELDIFKDSKEKAALLTISDYALNRGK